MANRLVQISSNCSGTKYDYDANGNRTSVIQVSIETIASRFDEKCGNDGQILITPQDSSAHYRYLWNNGKTTAGITNLVGGAYSVVITEPITGFTCNQTFTIKGIFKDSILVVPQQILCNGASDGKAKIQIVTPDTLGSYLYHWSTSTDTAYTPLDSLSDLRPGSYSVFIRNNKRNCVKMINFTITEPPPIIATISKNDASCPSVNDGELIVKVNGDSTNYTFAWTGAPINGTIAGQHLSGLLAGNYTLVVTQNGTLCTETQQVTIGVRLPNAVITANGPTTFFIGKNVLLSANTGPGYLYQWIKNGANINGAVDSVYTAQDAGSYTVRITANRCTLISDSIIIYTLPVNNFLVSETDETCRTSNNGSIDISTVTPLNYVATISGNSITTVNKLFTSTLHIPNLSAGSYQVCIGVDSQKTYNQCYHLIIREPKDLSVYNVAVNNVTKTVSMTLEGGTNYTIELNGHSFNTTDSTITLPVINGANTLRVTADKLCQGEFEREFTISDDIVVFPNPFDRTITVSLGKDQTKQIGVKIFDVLGTLVYSGTLINQNGFITVQLPDLIEGAYTLQLSISNQLFKIIRK